MMSLTEIGHKFTNKKDSATVFSLTSNMTFALASVIMDLKKYSSSLADEIVVFHDGMKNRDIRLLQTLANIRFIEYDFPMKDLSIFKNMTIERFSKMVFGKFECFRLLNEYKNVIFLDYDQIIQADISELLKPSESGLKLIPSDSTVRDGLHFPIDFFDMNNKSIFASIFVLQDNLKDFNRIYDWCYKKTGEYAGCLYLPEQAILDFMIQEFQLSPAVIDRNVYCCHPEDIDHLKSSKVIHAFGSKKFWNGWNFEQWNQNYLVWVRMGGSKYKEKSKSLSMRIARKLARMTRSLIGKLRNFRNMLVTSKQIRNTSVLYKYFLSEQYRKNTWTLTQCVKYALKFEQLYYSETFIRDFSALLAGLNEISQRRLKFIFARMIFFSFLNRDSLYDEEEMAKYRVETRIINNISKREKYYTLDDYSFINGNMTIHNFIDDMGLKDLESIDEIRDSSIIDVGAYVGDSSLILSKYTNKKVYAFEPFPEAFRELVENVSLNKSYKIEPVKFGISDICGVRKLYFAKVKNLSISTNDPERSLSKGEYDSIEIQTITIDKFVQENNITVGLIKIDAEGAERDVLEGARKTILRDKPIMLVSIYHNIDDFMHIKPWIENLELSYKYKIIKLEPTTFVEETMLVCY